MKKRIFLYYVILTIIGIFVTGFFTSNLTQKFYKDEVYQKLETACVLIKHSLQKKLSGRATIDYDQAAKEYTDVLLQGLAQERPSHQKSFRITLISFDGKVLGDSDTDIASMENHINRKEVQEALQGHIGQETRFSQTLQTSFLYVAVPLEPAKVVIRVSVPLPQLEKIDQIFWTYTLIGIVAGISLTFLLAFRFSTLVVYPVNELISFSKEIAKGNYSQRIHYTSRDEIGQLSQTFNEMAERLNKTMSEITDKNVKLDSILNSMTNGIIAVDRDYRIILINAIACEMFAIENREEVLGTRVIELVRHHQINMLLQDTIENNESLVSEAVTGVSEGKILRVYSNPIKSKDRFNINSGGLLSLHDITNLKKLEQIRTDFVSNVTHELKTPLTSIRGFIETLRGGAINDSAVADKFLEIIDIEAERLYMLINDILQLSEIESRHTDSNTDIYDLREIVSEILPLMQEVADRKNITLSVQLGGNLQLLINKNRIKQMLINLIDNAIKYNVDSGSVTISMFREAGKICIKVKDTGIGIPQEHIPRIFERFYRVDKGRSRSMGGTGLGLSIVKHIANLYNGDIKVTSEPGVGSEFTIQLPDG